MTKEKLADLYTILLMAEMAIRLQQRGLTRLRNTIILRGAWAGYRRLNRLWLDEQVAALRDSGYIPLPPAQLPAVSEAGRSNEGNPISSPACRGGSSNS